MQLNRLFKKFLIPRLHNSLFFPRATAITETTIEAIILHGQQHFKTFFKQ